MQRRGRSRGWFERAVAFGLWLGIGSFAASCGESGLECGPGTNLVVRADGSKICEPKPADCPEGYLTETGPNGATLCKLPEQPTKCDALECDVVPAQLDGQGVATLTKVLASQDDCWCVAATCKTGYNLVGSACVKEIECPQGFVQSGGVCMPCEDCTCAEQPDSPACIPVSCADYPNLAPPKCLETPPPPEQSCTSGCHAGIEAPHPWGPQSENLSCTGCHGGNSTAATREAAHVAIPASWQEGSPQWGRPNLRYYWNYNTLFGVENFPGGLEWLRFRNPSDLRVAEQSCGRSGCHEDRVLNTQRSVMATEVGLAGVAMARNGARRTVLRGEGGIYKFDTTEGMTLGKDSLDAIAYDATVPGSMRSLTGVAVKNRENFGGYGQTDLLTEVYDKQCGDCHLGNAGANNRYADFRSSGCGGCHSSYALDGRSRSTDQMIKKDEPTYPAAYAQIANFNVNDLNNVNGAWLGPERAHPTTHRITKQMASQKCGTCHVGSNRTDWQYRGYRFDPNRDGVLALDNNRLNANQIQFTDEIDNVSNPFARYHGAAQNQILKYEDWNQDNIDDTPADVHFLAGLECMDCHTSAEVHNEIKLRKVKKVTDPNDKNQVIDMSGAIWAHMDQATEIECVDCHGNLEYRAQPYEVDNRNPIKNLILCPEQGEVVTYNPTTDPNAAEVTYSGAAECREKGLGRGRWLRSKFTGKYHYVPQVKDTVQNYAQGGGPVRPGNNQAIYSANASVFHGRVNNDLADGIGPCVNANGVGDPNACFKDVNNNTPIRPEFSHLGDKAQHASDQGQGGLECFACHSTWVNACFGCHLTLADFNGQTLRDYARSTGELTYGQVAQADFTFIDPLAIQLGINSEGKIWQFLPETKQGFRHIDDQGQDFFGTKVLVNNDADLVYNVYRHRTGYGLRQYNTELVGLDPDSDGRFYDQDARMDDNAGQGFNQMMPHSVQRSHPMMACTQCHLDQNANNAAAVTARYGSNPNGFANVSAYLARLDGLAITRNNTGQQVVVDQDLGFRLDANTDPDAFTVNQQMDWIVRQADGFPLSYSNHPFKWGASPSLDYQRTYQNVQAPVSGPLTQPVLERVTVQIKTFNITPELRGTR